MKKTAVAMSNVHPQTVSNAQQPSSYHDKIQEAARTIEIQRAKRYDNYGADTIKWTETELEFMYAILYKILRVKTRTRAREKAKDDIIDVYNFCALLYEEVSK